jgi:5-methylcytosine-specific restriction endonuclease McrA
MAPRPIEAARNRVYKFYRAGAIRRGLAWELSKEIFFDVTQRQCHYCGVAPGRVSRTFRGGVFTYNGVDRPDNDRGYTEDNVVACCSICNHAKHIMSYDAFNAWLQRVTEHRSMLTDTVV